MNWEREPYDRNESVAHKLDRNYLELLQELRVSQMGVQILFAFLLSIAFQQRFESITTFQRDVYIATLICAAISAVLFIAPVPMHRAMFRRHLKNELVFYTSRLAVGGLVFLALAMLGAVLLIIDFVVGPVSAGIIVAVIAAVFGYFWLVLPLIWRSRSTEEQPPPVDAGLVP
jgi:hypothetical protein